MISEQEALVPVLMAEIRQILFARLACSDIRCEGGDFVVEHRGVTARVDVPEIENVYLDARALSDQIESLLTGGQ